MIRIRIALTVVAKDTTYVLGVLLNVLYGGIDKVPHMLLDLQIN